MNLGISIFCQHNISCYSNILCYSRTALHAQHGRTMAFVHYAFLNQRRLLIVVNNNLVKGAKIIIAVQQNLGGFGKMTIIGESNGSSLCHISYLSHFLTLLALGYGTNNLNMYYSILFSPLLHSLNQSCCINNRIGIWHGSYSGVATSSCCLGAGSKILLGLLTWFSQMNMHVNQTWRNNFACSLHNLSTLSL